tara:strand:- start:2367 stop:2615 length:249 start_codon:yes stop_codon:yes gene_type:complete
MEKGEVKEGGFYRLSQDVGYTESQSKKAMQVMECWGDNMTVKCKGGCMTKPYSDFDEVVNLDEMRDVYYADYFEDNRLTKKQ